MITITLFVACAINLDEDEHMGRSCNNLLCKITMKQILENMSFFYTA
jgi:hypothetical protein